jgi:hypothetical protein
MSLKWNDDSAMFSKHSAPLCTHENLLVGGSRAEMVGTGVSITDGNYSWFGGKITGDSSSRATGMKSVPGVGVFAYVSNDTDDDFELHKLSQSSLEKGVASPDSSKVLDIPDLDVGGSPTDTLQHSLVDLGWHTLAAGLSRVLLFCVYDPNGVDTRIMVSESLANATAGDTWTDLFGEMSPAIRHWHGGKYIPGKGLYLFTGDDDIQCSILFCPEAEIPDLIDTPAPFHATNWLLATNSRAAWSGDETSAYILLGNTQESRTVEFVTADNKIAYYFPDSSSSRVIKKADLTGSGPGTVSDFKTDVNNTGWYGGVSKSGMVYLSSLSVWGDDTGEPLTGHTANADIWAIDPEDETCELVKSIPRKDYVPALSITPTALSSAGLKIDLFDFGGAMFTKGFFWRMSDSVPILGDATVPDTWYCGRVEKQKKPTANFITNGDFASGDVSNWTFGGTMNNVGHGAITNGPFQIGDVITGSESGATGTINTVDTPNLDFHFTNDSVTGIFKVGETLTGSVSEASATLTGLNTFEVVTDAPGISGNALRLVIQTKDLPFTSANFYPTLTAAQDVILNGRHVTYSCRLYIDATTEDSSSQELQLRNYINPGDDRRKRTENYATVPGLTKNTWMDFSLSNIAATGATTHQYQFIPNFRHTGDVYALYYLTDFQLVNGAVANSDIKALVDSRTGARGYRARYK